MAKSRPNAATQTQPSEQTHRLGLTVDVQTHLLISTAAALRDCTPAELLSDAAWAIVGGWPVRERDAVLSVVKARFGRLKRSCGPAVAESAPEPTAGQQGGAVDSSAVVPQLVARTAMITNRFVEVHSPLDAALHEVGGGN
jgi:hypothetical protein